MCDARNGMVGGVVTVIFLVHIMISRELYEVGANTLSSLRCWGLDPEFRACWANVVDQATFQSQLLPTTKQYYSYRLASWVLRRQRECLSAAEGRGLFGHCSPWPG